MTRTRIWVDGRLVIDEEFDLDSHEAAKERSGAHGAIIRGAKRRRKVWTFETVDENLPPSRRRYVLGERRDEAGYVSGPAKFLGLLLLFCLLLVPFILVDLVGIFLVLGVVALVRHHRVRRGQAAWRERSDRG